MNRTHMVVRFGLVSLGVVAAGILLAVVLQGRSVDIPAPDDLESLDPMIVHAINGAMGRVHADQSDAQAWYELGLVYEANGLPQPAVECYDIALQHDGPAARIHLRKALIANLFNEPERAIGLISRAIELEPKHAPLHWRLGFWQLEQGNLDAAQAAFDRARAVDSTDPGGWFGWVQLRLQQRRGEEVIDLLEGPLQDGPFEAYARSQLRRAYRQAGRDADAASLTDTDPTEPRWRDAWTDEVISYQTGLRVHRRRAERNLERGKLKAALEDVNAMLRFREDDGDLHNIRGVTLLRIGHVEQGMQALLTSAKLSPDSPTAWINMARALQAIGKLDDALRAAERALQVEPDSDEIQQLQQSIIEQRNTTQE